MINFKEWLINEASGQYAIIYRGIDGSDIKKFSNLSAVARYLKERDQGSDYRRIDGLQTDYAFYTFRGFTWNDILNGNMHDENTQYKHELLSAPIRIMFKTSVYNPNTLHAVVEGETKGHIDKQQDGTFSVSLEDRSAFQRGITSLDLAKNWIKEKLEGQHKERYPVPMQSTKSPAEQDYEDRYYDAESKL